MAEKGDCSGALKLLEEIKVDMAEANRLALSKDSGNSLTPAEGSLVYEAVWKAGSLLSAE